MFCNAGKKGITKLMNEIVEQLKKNGFALLLVAVSIVGQWSLYNYRLDRIEKDLEYIKINYVTQRERSELLDYLRNIDGKLDRINERLTK